MAELQVAGVTAAPNSNAELNLVGFTAAGVAGAVGPELQLTGFTVAGGLGASNAVNLQIARLTAGGTRLTTYQRTWAYDPSLGLLRKLTWYAWSPADNAWIGPAGPG